MRLLTTPEVEAFVRDHGGRLYVWTDRTRCCGGPLTLLRTSLDPPKGVHRFRELAGEPFSVLLDSGIRRPPEELHVELKGRHRKRVDAFWNGCAYVLDAILESPFDLRQA